jgi:dTDP-4-dehydrorhamnose reductase
VQEPLAWVTGAGGLIGNYLVQAAPSVAPGWRVIGWTRSLLDLTDFDAVRRAFQQERPQLIIHCAALSRSPVCQANPALAWKSNVEVTQRLGEIASEISFILFSSDLVFDGKKGGYIETDSVNPLSIYAETKVAAEQLVLPNPKHSVIRTSLNGGTSLAGDRGFNEELRQAWRAGQTIKLFKDEFRSPIPAQVTARAIWELAAQERPGLYHLAGSERLSRWQIGQLIAARWPELYPKLEASSLAEYQGAPRPPDSSLNCHKVQSLLSFPLPGLRDWLARHPAERF